MNQIIYPSAFAGSFKAPPSKSYLQRAIAIAAMANHAVEIDGYAPSKDVDAAIAIAQNLGAEVDIHPQKIILKGNFSVTKIAAIYGGEAGLSARMFAPIAALKEEKINITGEGSLLKRPMHMVIDALQQLGKSVNSNNGFLPLEISGKLIPQSIQIDASESSQLLTGLLIALPFANGNSEIKVAQLNSIPYIQMTLDILQQFGIKIQHTNFQHFFIEGNQRVKAVNYTVEGDWSGAAFHLVAAAIAGRVSIEGLQKNSAQADKAILQALEQVGASIYWLNENSVEIHKNKLQAFEFDATHCPDLFPPLAALAANCKGISKVKGVKRLLHKESNRALSIQSELQKFGIHVELKNDEMWIDGGNISGGKIHSHNDHRIAMMAAVLALNANAPVEIEEAEAIQKSYPAFFDDFISCQKNRNKS
ncbi:MAG: 3-phosphoshikimate 1-carboxyvinyltransferase [Bacteroidia bacterium]